jgi:hypothetical protein
MGPWSEVGLYGYVQSIYLRINVVKTPEDDAREHCCEEHVLCTHVL